jgi:HlyD family secretion protein
MKDLTGISMLKYPLRWSIILILIVGVGCAIWYYSRPEPVEVIVKPVTIGMVERTVANTRAGTIKACRRAKLSPSIGGQIARLPIEKGESVKKGELLLALWNRDIVAQVELSKQEILSAKSRSKAACLNADIAQKNADRLLNLRKSRAVSEEQTDNATAKAAALMAQCAAAKSEVAIQNAQLAVAKANLDRTRLTAPFDGVIAEINGELYEYVTPSPVGVATLPAVDILDNGCFYVVAPIDEVDAAAIRVGMPTRITMDAFINREFEGKVRRIADYVVDIEKQARTVDVEVSFTHHKDLDLLLAGYSADIEVIIKRRKTVTRVPTEAIFEGKKVYLFDPNLGRIHLKTIETGLSNWNQTEVKKGLSPQDLVVTNVDKPGLADDALAVRIEETQ